MAARRHRLAGGRAVMRMQTTGKFHLTDVRQHLLPARRPGDWLERELG